MTAYLSTVSETDFYALMYNTSHSYILASTAGGLIYSSNSGGSPETTPGSLAQSLKAFPADRPVLPS